MEEIKTEIKSDTIETAENLIKRIESISSESLSIEELFKRIETATLSKYEKVVLMNELYRRGNELSEKDKTLLTFYSFKMSEREGTFDSTSETVKANIVNIYKILNEIRADSLKINFEKFISVQFLAATIIEETYKDNDSFRNMLYSKTTTKKLLVTKNIQINFLNGANSVGIENAKSISQEILKSHINNISQSSYGSITIDNQKISVDGTDTVVLVDLSIYKTKLDALVEKTIKAYEKLFTSDNASEEFENLQALIVQEIENDFKNLNSKNKILKQKTNNALTKARHMDLRKAKMDLSTQGLFIIPLEGVTFYIQDYENVKKFITAPTLKILDFLMTESYGHYEKETQTFTATVNEYMDFKGLKDEKTAKSQLRQAFSFLQMVTWSSEETIAGKKSGDFTNIGIYGGFSQVKNGTITFTFGKKFVEQYNNCSIQKKPKAIVQTNDKTNPYSYFFGATIANHGPVLRCQRKSAMLLNREPFNNVFVFCLGFFYR